MAKIVVLSKKASSQALGLAQALHMQRHEVTFVTGFKEQIDVHLPFTILTYFKSWSLLEAIKFFPRLLGYSPEILHIVVSEKNPQEVSVAALALASFIKSLPNRLVALTSYDAPSSRSRIILKPLLRLCDIVTFGTREVLMYHKRKGDLKHNKVTEVLPPLLEFAPKSFDMGESHEDLLKIAEKLHPYFVIPAPLLSPEVNWDEFSLGYNFIVLGPRPLARTSGNFFFVGDSLKSAELEFLLKNSSGIYLASENFGILELIKFHAWSLQFLLPVFANRRQSEALPGLCVHEKNGWVISDGLKSFEQLLKNKPRPKIEPQASQQSIASLTDSTLNELSRLYSKAFEQKLSNPL